MIITNLAQSLMDCLSQADEIWISVALITEEGFSFIQRELSVKAHQNYVVGLDLFPSMSVLKKLHSRHNETSFKARISKPTRGIFHPKLYLIRKKDCYTAYLGSANLTTAGLYQNTELSFQVSEQEACRAFLLWFREQYETAYPLNEENIKLYWQQFANKVDKTPDELPIEISLIREPVTIDPFAGIDFSDRYFSKSDHLAFRKELWADDSPGANRERKKAQDRFLDLHHEIYGRFPQFDLDGLFSNRKNHIVSMYYHLEGHTQASIDAMWLSYGKSQDEIQQYHELFPSVNDENEENDKQSFINHARLQIRIELKEIGIWLLFGKNNGGSIFDRKHFFEQMKSESYRHTFFIMLKDLPDEYWVWANNESARHISEFRNQEELYRFCKRDHPQHYFAIGRDYKITDPAMSNTQLPKTVLAEFQRLHPLYKTMRHYF